MGTQEADRGSAPLVRELAVLPGHVLWRAAAKANQAMRESTEVDLHHYAALLTLAEPTTSSQRALADAIGVSRTTVGTIAADLIARGFVERTRNPDDRRSYLLHRTSSGAAWARDNRERVATVEIRLTDGFTAGERDELRALLGRIAGPTLPATTLEALRESIGFLVVWVHGRLHAAVAEAFDGLRIEPRHMGTLAALDARGVVSQAELARMLGVSGPAVVQIVDDLASAGVLERRRSQLDRRHQELHLLPAGLDLLPRARHLADGVVDETLAPLSARERQRLLELLVALVTTPYAPEDTEG